MASYLKLAGPDSMTCKLPTRTSSLTVRAGPSIRPHRRQATSRQPPRIVTSPQRLESGAYFFRVELRLFPGGEVPALGQLVVMHELRVGLFAPALRRLEEFVGEGADRYGNLDAL